MKTKTAEEALRLMQSVCKMAARNGKAAKKIAEESAKLQEKAYDFAQKNGGKGLLNGGSKGLLESN